MKKRHWVRKITALVLAAGLAITGIPGASFWGTEVVEAAESYTITVTPTEKTIDVGENVTFTAVVKDPNGDEVTNLEEAGIALWWYNAAAVSDNGNTNGHSLTATFSWNTPGDYEVKADLKNNTSENEAWIAGAYPTVHVESAEPTYNLTVKASKKSYIDVNGTVKLSADIIASDESPLTLGSEYKLWWWVDTDMGCNDANISDVDTNTGTINVGTATEVNVTLQSIGEYYIKAQLKKGDEQVAIYTIKLSSEPVEDVYVEQIPVDNDFIKGVDISSLESELESGVQFYNYKGEPIKGTGTGEELLASTEKAFFDFLKENGVNWVRIRVWNNPYSKDEPSKGYGGGNCDLVKAKRMGKAATDAGLKVLIDFHYSDTWADPKRQLVPKAWKSYSTDQIIAAIGTYTEDSLTELINYGVDVEMVQIGNETSNTICGIKESEGVGNGYESMQRMCQAFNSGSAAVRKVAQSKTHPMKVAIHIESPQEEGKYLNYAEALNRFGVDYDVFASSYYPMWHGTLDNLNTVLSTIATTYKKEVMVAETSWSYTLSDGDGWSNEVGEGSGYDNYDYTVQGQVNELVDVIKTVANTTNGIGVFYWEPAWIPVNCIYDDDGQYISTAKEANQKAWETYGSGWATKICAEYDKDNVGENGAWAGGSAVDNHAWFDYYGYPLASLKTFKDIKDGQITLDREVWKVVAEDVSVFVGEDITTPSVRVRYNYGSDQIISDVNWNNEAISAAKVAGVGEYEINGTVDVNGKSYPVKFVLKIFMYNYLKNPSLENQESDVWTLVGPLSNVKIIADNPHDGEKALKYDGALTDVGIYQVVTLDRGVYKFGAYLQGSVKASGENYQIYATVGDQTKTAEASPVGWGDNAPAWQNPEITDIRIVRDGTQVVLGCKMTTTSGAWGTWDDFYLNKVADVEHQIVKVDAKNPTCTEAGNIEYYKCNECGELYRDAAGTVAITETDTVVAATGHSWNEGVVTTPATATSKGVKTYTCTVCGATRTEEVDYVAPQPQPQPQPNPQPQPAPQPQPDPQPQPQPQPQPEVEAQSQNITGVKSSYTKTYGNKAFSLGAKAKTTLTYSSSNKKVVTVDKNGKVTIKGVGNAVITIKAKATDEYKAATKKVKITINQAKQTIKVSVSGKTYKVNDLNKKKKTFKINASAKTSLTYKVEGSTKYISVSKKGVVTVKKGAKKGTYKIIVTAKSSTNYKSATKTITIKVK